MKKLLFKVAMMLVIVVGISNYGLYLMTGKSPFSNFSFSKIEMPTASVDNMLPKGKEQVYKWVDANGVTQYSSEAPPELENAEVMQVDPNTNMVQGLKIEEKPKENAPEAPTVGMPNGPIYSPETVKKIMDDAKEVRRMMDERAANQEKALEHL